jgi:hypothetical protein
VRGRHASHITVVLSKAAHSGPSVCLRARAPCPLCVSCPGADRAERAAQAAGVSVLCKLQVLALPRLLGSRHEVHLVGTHTDPCKVAVRIDLTRTSSTSPCHQRRRSWLARLLPSCQSLRMEIRETRTASSRESCLLSLWICGV